MHKNKITTAAIMMILSSAALTPVMAEEVQNTEENTTQIEQSTDLIDTSSEDTTTTPEPTTEVDPHADHEASEDTTTTPEPTPDGDTTEPTTEVDPHADHEASEGTTTTPEPTPDGDTTEPTAEVDPHADHEASEGTTTPDDTTEVDPHADHQTGGETTTPDDTTEVDSHEGHQTGGETTTPDDTTEVDPHADHQAGGETTTPDPTEEPTTDDTTEVDPHADHQTGGETTTPDDTTEVDPHEGHQTGEHTEKHVSSEDSLVQGSVINAVKGESAYVKINIKDENLNSLTSAQIKTNDGKIIDLKLDADSQIIKLDPETISFNIEYVSLDKTYMTHKQTITWTEKEDTTQPSKVDAVVEELSKESGLSIDKSEDNSEINIAATEEIVVGIVNEALDKENTSIEVNDGVLEIKIENTIIKSSKELTTIEKNANEKYEITSNGMISKYALKAPVALKSARAFSLFSVSALAAEPQWDLVYTIDTKENTIQYANGEVKSFQSTANMKLLVDANGNIQEPVLDIIEENDGTPTDPVTNEPGNNDGTPTDPVTNEPGNNDGTPTDPATNEPENNDGTPTDPVNDDNTSNPVNNEVEDNNSELPKTGANMLGSISTMVIGAASILTGGLAFNRRNKK